MPPKSIEQEIQTRVAAFAADLGALIRQSVLDSLHQSLGVAPAPRTSTATAPVAAPMPARKGRGKGKRGQRGAPVSGAASAEILDYVATNPSSRLEQIAKGLGKASATLKSTVAAMLASGALTKTGQRRGTSYSTGSGVAPAASEGAAPGKRRGRKPGPKKGAKRANAGRAAKRVTKKKNA